MPLLGVVGELASPSCPHWENAAEMGTAWRRATKMVPGLENVPCCEM